MSSTKRLVLIGSFSPDNVMPFRSGLAHIMHARGSIPRLNIGHERESPWQMPLVILKVLLRVPFIATCVFAFW